MRGRLTDYLQNGILTECKCGKHSIILYQFGNKDMILAVMINRIFQKKCCWTVFQQESSNMFVVVVVLNLFYILMQNVDFVSHDCKFGDVIRVCGRNSIFIACLSMCRLDDITYFCGKICKHRICVCTKYEYE